MDLHAIVSVALCTRHNTIGMQTFRIASGSLARGLHLSWQNQPNSSLPLHYHQSTRRDYVRKAHLWHKVTKLLQDHLDRRP